LKILIQILAFSLKHFILPSMEMVEMDANLVELDYVEGINDISHTIKTSLEDKVLNTEEFLSILSKTEEWNLLDKEKIEIIQTSLNKESVQKIFKIMFLDATVGAGATWALAISGLMETEEIKELVFGVFRGEIPLENLLKSQTLALYISKLIGMVIMPYVIWRKDKVKHKVLKSAMNGVPLIGSWAFPVWAFWDEKEFLKFFKVYRKTKKTYRAIIKEQDDEERTKKEDVFKKLLETKVVV